MNRSVGLLALGAFVVVLSAACTRSANQTNYLGKQCKTSSDCGPDGDLTCFEGICRAQCSGTRACPGGETCQSGACVAGTSGGGDGTDGGGLSVPSGPTTDAGDGPQSGGDGGGNPNTVTFDGTTLQSAIGLGTLSLSTISAGEGYVAWSEAGSDLSGSFVKLHVAPDTAGAAAVTLDTTTGPSVSSGYATAIRGGKIYWRAPSASGAYQRANLDGSAKENVPALPSIALVTQIGDYLYFEQMSGPSTALGWYKTTDGSTGSLGQMGQFGGPLSSAFGSDGTTVMWFGSGTTTFPIYKSALGAASGTNTNATVSSSISAPVAGTVLGTKFVYVTQVSQTTTIASLDSASAGAVTPQPVASGIQGSPASQMIAFDATHAYLAGVVGSPASLAIMAYPLAGGAPTQIAALAGTTRSVAVTDGKIYWAEEYRDQNGGGGGGSRLLRIGMKTLQ